MESGIKLLLGKTLVSIKNEDDERIIFKDTNGNNYVMHHHQDCCENVTVSDINGDFEDLINYPILLADESTNSEDTFNKIDYPESFTWTFYHLATVKGFVTITWLGQSNGYYSESVDFELLNN